MAALAACLIGGCGADASVAVSNTSNQQASSDAAAKKNESALKQTRDELARLQGTVKDLQSKLESNEQELSTLRYALATAGSSRSTQTAKVYFLKSTRGVLGSSGPETLAEQLAQDAIQFNGGIKTMVRVGEDETEAVIVVFERK